jgi:hypothetical protein
MESAEAVDNSLLETKIVGMKVILLVLAVCFAVLLIIGLKFQMEEWTPAARAARAAKEEANKAILKRMADDEAAVRRKQADDEAARLARDPKLRTAKEQSLMLELRVKCAELYRNTADMKWSNLTVRQADLIGTCRQFGLYKP